jgi:hypothetical protein
MHRYRNWSGTSGILGYEAGLDFIRVWWEEDKPYTYTYVAAGVEHVETMKRLAKNGSHLNAYINQHPKIKNGFVK